MNRREALAISIGVAGLAACSAPFSSINASERQAALSGFAVNLESWYADLPFEKRFDKAARDGFRHVEFWFIDSWDRKAADLAKYARDAGVSIAQIVGDCPPLALPESRENFLENCKRAVENADKLNCEIVTLTGHQNVAGYTAAQSLKAYQNHMTAAAPIFEDAKIYAAIEPFNPYDHPGHFIYGSREAAKIVRAVGSAYLKLNWDLFHMQRHEGELIGNLKRFADTVGYVQFADAPDRAQPGTGDINFVNVLKQVRAGGYERPIGLELWAKNKDYDQAILDILDLSKGLDSSL